MNDLQQAFSEVTPRDNLKVAALDIGSNSFHLVVARIVADDVQILHRLKQKVRLAHGLDEDGNLDDEAIERGLAALKSMADSLNGFEPEEVRIVATNTLRRAKNARRFITLAKKVFAYPIEIISGAEEARLIYQGVAHTSQNNGQKLVVDIGGGSTEFIIGEGFQPKLLRSLQLGCVTYTNQFFSKGVISAKEFKRAITCAKQELELIDKKYINVGWEQAIGTSGTIRAISRICEQCEWVESSDTITLSAMRKLKDACCDLGDIEKLNFQNISEDRLQVLPAGLAILIAIFERLAIDNMQFSASALREGVLYEMEDRLAHNDIRERTANSFATRYDVDIEQAQRVLAMTQHLYQQVAKAWQINNDEYANLIGWASLLHEVGLQINSRGVQRHSAYILSNSEMPGFTQDQQLLLSTLVRFHRKKIRVADIEEFANFPAHDVYKLIAILRLSIMLNLKRQDQDLSHVSANAHKHTLCLTFTKDELNEDPIFLADIESESERLKSLDIDLNYQVQSDQA